MENKGKVEFLEKSMQKLMGEIIDSARISEMSDRAFKQYERTTKIKFNNLIRIFKEHIFDVKEEEKED